MSCRFGFWFGFFAGGLSELRFTRFVVTGSKTLQKHSLGLGLDDPFLIAAWAADTRACTGIQRWLQKTGDQPTASTKPQIFTKSDRFGKRSPAAWISVHRACSANLALMRSFASGGSEASEALSACSGNLDTVSRI